ncbi:hypothetical protein BJ978_002344 [Agromyces terreus]|uniref:Phospholipase n=1 Tax=Agromyces terreus TaxID=424795 RepID=A0A9X2H2C0_9MICO|nr:hypothetical protein [Agromyces terreus]MCP2371668.1 hypothetical protein [Agromyces terreus]
MRPTTNSTPAPSISAPDSTPRRSLRSRRTVRRRFIAAGAVLAVGLVAGTGFAVQNAFEADARAQATAQLTKATGLSADSLGVYSSIAAAKVKAQAEDTITLANATLEKADGKVDASALAASVASLSDYETIPTDDVADLTKETKAAAAKTAADTTAFEQAQAAAAAKAAAEAAQALAAANTPDGARATARSLASSMYGWGDDQFQCLDSLWAKESGWSYTAYNDSSGATGIPQSLPGSKMASAGADWATNAATQIKWGLGYIAGSYGSPCSAWSHSQSVNWY